MGKPRTYLQIQSAISNAKIRSIRGAGAMLVFACHTNGMHMTEKSILLIVDALVDREKWKYQNLRKKHLEKVSKKSGVDRATDLS